MIQHMTLTMTTTSIMSHVSLKHYESLLSLFFSATRDYCYVRFWICSLFFQIQTLRLLVSTSFIISQSALYAIINLYKCGVTTLLTFLMLLAEAAHFMRLNCFNRPRQPIQFKFS